MTYLHRNTLRHLEKAVNAPPDSVLHRDQETQDKETMAWDKIVVLSKKIAKNN